jgi:4-hydroxybenzoate polyprenyltransferase
MIITDPKNKWQNFGGQLAESLLLFYISTLVLHNEEEVKQRLANAFNWVLNKLGLQFTQLLIAFLIMGIGTGAYFFKRKNQKWYGIVEILIGFLSAVVVAGSLLPHKLDLAKWATLAGSAYVVARGLENRAKGIELLKARAM